MKNFNGKLKLSLFLVTLLFTQPISSAGKKDKRWYLLLGTGLNSYTADIRDDYDIHDNEGVNSETDIKPNVRIGIGASHKINTHSLLGLELGYTYLNNTVKGLDVSRTPLEDCFANDNCGYIKTKGQVSLSLKTGLQIENSLIYIAPGITWTSTLSKAKNDDDDNDGEISVKSLLTPGLSFAVGVEHGVKSWKNSRVQIQGKYDSIRSTLRHGDSGRNNHNFSGRMLSFSVALEKDIFTKE